MHTILTRSGDIVPIKGSKRNAGFILTATNGKKHDLSEMASRKIIVKKGNPYRNDGGQFGTGNGDEPKDTPAERKVILADGFGADDIMAAADIAGDDRARSYEFREGDLGMAAINKQIGNDGLPRIVTAKEYKKYLDADGVGLYRGFGNETHLEQYLNGKHYAGQGLFGSGTYASTARAVAKAYTTDGSILRMGIDSSAKIVKHSVISAEIKGLWKTYADNLSDPKFYAAFGSIVNNTGRYAAMRGYDGMQVVDPFTGNDQFVIFNRAAVIVREGK